MSKFATCALSIASLAVFILKLTLALNTYGTNDVLTWERNTAKLNTDGGLAWYRDGVEIPVTRTDGSQFVRIQLNNHPPLVIPLLRSWDFLARISGLPFRFWLRFTSALADIGSLFLVWKILTASRIPISPLALLLVVCSPVSLMVSGFHGNTDPIMIFLLLISVYLIESGRPSWLAGVAFGLSMSIKVAPLIFAPIFLLYLPSMRKRIGFAVCAGCVFVAGCMPYLAQDPGLIVHRVFGYGGSVGSWGVSRLIYLFLPEVLFTAYTAVGKWIALCIVAVASIRMNWRDSKPALFSQCGLVAFLFLFWTPGFGVQYLAWLIPWTAAFSWRAIRFFYAASGTFLFLFYTLWSRGFPWFLANAFDNVLPFWPRVVVIVIETACWVSVGALALRYHRWLVPDSSAEDSTAPFVYRGGYPVYSSER